MCASKAYAVVPFKIISSGNFETKNTSFVSTLSNNAIDKVMQEIMEGNSSIDCAGRKSDTLILRVLGIRQRKGVKTSH